MEVVVDLAGTPGDGEPLGDGCVSDSSWPKRQMAWFTFGTRTMAIDFGMEDRETPS